MEAQMTIKPGPELDRMVAERVMGWTWGSITLPAGFDAFDNWTEQHDIEGPITKPGSPFPRSYWSPSRDIAHAWEVVERVTRVCSDKNPWTGMPIATVFANLFQNRDMWAETASDVAFLICRFALMAVGETKL
jgi:hypothetical protein